VKVLPNSVTTRNFPFFLPERQKNVYPSVEIIFSWCDNRIQPHSLRLGPEGLPFVLAELMRGLCQYFTGITELHLDFQASIPIDPHQHFDIVRKFLFLVVGKLHGLTLYNHETVEFLSPYFFRTPRNPWGTVHPMEFKKLHAVFFYDMNLGRICGKRTMNVLQAYIDGCHAARNRTVSLLGFGQVEGMTKDAVRWFRNAGVDVVHNSGSFGVEAGSCDAI